MTALIVGTALAVASLCYVLYPLLRPDAALGIIPRRPKGRDAGSSSVDALRELEFDRQTGKISDSDYGTLKARYTEEALIVMRSAGSGSAACAACGPRPESDATFCSNCGARLLA